MKSFKVYLTEGQKTYDFRIRVAGELPNDFTGTLKKALEPYVMISSESVKRLPIQETSLFPNMGPVEVNIVDVTLQYPCTDAQLMGLIAEAAGLNQSCLRITPTNSPFEAALAGKEQSNKDGKIVLTDENLAADPVPKDLVGDSRIPLLIKELEETRKYEYSQAAGGATPSAKTTNTIDTQSISPVGSKQNKISSPKRG